MKSINKLLAIAFFSICFSHSAKADIGISGFISYSNHNYTVINQDSMPGAGATMHTNVTVQNFSPAIPANSVYFYMRYPNSSFLKPDSIVSIPTGWELTDSILVGNETILRFTNTAIISAFQTSYFAIRVIAVDESSEDFNAIFAQMQYVSGLGSGWAIFATSLTGLIETASIGNEPLPVEWYSFNAQIKHSSVHLTWSTISEKNNEGFFIEKSTDGVIWNEIGFENSKANNEWGDVKINYNFIDNDPSEGINMYRLRQVDFDGIYSYSWIREVNFIYPHFTPQIYPNPSKGKVTVIAKNVLHIIVTDVRGVQMRTISLNKDNVSSTELDLTDLAKGFYSILVVGNDNFYSYQLSIIE